MNKYKPDELDKFFQQAKELVADAQYKLRAIDLRQFIDQIYPREGEISKHNLDEIIQSFVGLNKRVSSIENYLAIDFKLDGSEQERIAEPPVEYNFIKDSILRDELSAYYREMLRYQYACRNHKQCFGEFCRLATIQIEFMLNYFFSDDKKFEFVKEEVVKIAEIKFNNAFKNWYKKGGELPNKQYYIDQMFNNKADSVSQLNYSTKSKNFCNNYLKETFIRHTSTISISIYTSEMRNRKSHGSKTTLEPYEEEYLTEVEKTNLEQWEKELLDLVEEFNKTQEKKILYENKRLIAEKEVWKKKMPEELKELYNTKFLPLQWVSEKSFKDVHDFLRIIASTCAKELGKKEES